MRHLLASSQQLIMMAKNNFETEVHCSLFIGSRLRSSGRLDQESGLLRNLWRQGRVRPDQDIFMERSGSFALFHPLRRRLHDGQVRLPEQPDKGHGS